MEHRRQRHGPAGLHAHLRRHAHDVFCQCLQPRRLEPAREPQASYQTDQKNAVLAGSARDALRCDGALRFELQRCILNGTLGRRGRSGSTKQPGPGRAKQTPSHLHRNPSWVLLGAPTHNKKCCCCRTTASWRHAPPNGPCRLTQRCPSRCAVRWAVFERAFRVPFECPAGPRQLTAAALTALTALTAVPCATRALCGVAVGQDTARSGEAAHAANVLSV